MNMADFATQIGVTRLPNLTADGRDGFPSRAQHDWCVEQYLEDMCEKKRGKALVDKSLYDRILAVCFDESNKKTETAQFRWWVRRTFKLYTETHGHYLMHENRPIAVKEQIYDILVYAHAECGHGGRDKTSAAVRKYFSWIPKDVVSRFVSVCPGCHARTQKDDEYFANKGVDGYYPVHNKVRELSISRKLATAEDFVHTSPYQPLLALGMIKILKSLEAVPSGLSSIAVEGPFDISQFSLLPSDAEAKASQPYSHLVNTERDFEQSFHTSHFPLSLSSAPLGAVVSPSSLPSEAGFIHGPLQGQSYSCGTVQIDREPRYTPSLLSARVHPNYLSQISVSNAPSHNSHNSRIGSSTDVQSDKNYLGFNKENVPLSQGICSEPSLSSNHFTRPEPNTAVSVKEATRSPIIARVAKPLPKSQARKTSSLTKAHKKLVLSEPFVQSPSSTCLTTNAASQSSRQSAAASEDDNTSKSDFSSPSNYHPVLLPQYSLNSQSYAECAKGLSHHDRMLDHSDVSTDHRAEYSLPDVTAFNNMHTNRSYADGLNLKHKQNLSPADHWNNSRASDQEYRLQDFPSNHGFNYSPTGYPEHNRLLEHGESGDASISQPGQHKNSCPASWNTPNRFQETFVVPDNTYSSHTPLPTETVDSYGNSSNRSSTSSLTQSEDVVSHRFGDRACVQNPDGNSGFVPNSLGLDFSSNYPLRYDQPFSVGSNHQQTLMPNGLSHCLNGYQRPNVEIPY